MAQLLRNVQLVAAEAGPVEVIGMYIKQVVAQRKRDTLPAKIFEINSGIRIAEQERHIRDSVAVKRAFGGVALLETRVVAKVLVGEIGARREKLAIRITHLAVDAEVGHIGQVVHYLLRLVGIQAGA